MRQHIQLIVATIVLTLAPTAWSKQMDVTDLALCTAAAMKSGQGINTYQKWSAALEKRYKVIFPNLTAKQLDSYTAERTVDKRRELERRGIHTTPAFLKFFKDNCEPFSPF